MFSRLVCLALVLAIGAPLPRALAPAQAAAAQRRAAAERRSGWAVLGRPIAAAGLVYHQPADPNGGLYQSSWWDPDESDYDQYVWDSFELAVTAVITEVQWRGGYDPAGSGAGGPVLDFDVAFYPSIPGGSEPDVVHPPLVSYPVGGNAGETLAGSLGGLPLYDYAFALPTPFQAVAGVKYWLQVEAYQHGHPDWGLAAATGGNGSHFRRRHDVGNTFQYQSVPGDAAFALLGPAPDPLRVYLPLVLSH